MTASASGTSSSCRQAFGLKYVLALTSFSDEMSSPFVIKVARNVLKIGISETDICGVILSLRCHLTTHILLFTGMFVSYYTLSQINGMLSDNV